MDERCAARSRMSVARRMRSVDVNCEKAVIQTDESEWRRRKNRSNGKARTKWSARCAARGIVAKCRMK
eukprot:5786800-Pleurochrysis_carterae.AAC.1